MDRPDSVRRVMPPTTTMQKTSAATMSSQRAMAAGRAAGAAERKAVAVMGRVHAPKPRGIQGGAPGTKCPIGAWCRASAEAERVLPFGMYEFAEGGRNGG